MTTQDSLNQLEELLIAERKFFKDKFPTAYPDDMIDRCKRIISKMRIPPEVYSNEENAIELVYKVRNVYIAVAIYKNEYAMFMDINNTECGWVSLTTAWETVKWWNVLTAMAENLK